MQVRHKTPLARFEANIEPGGGGCWMWTRATNTQGYGRMWVDGKLVLPHRWSYEYHVGEIPEGLHLDHLCRNTSCCNPWHLEPVTPAINAQRGLAPERMRRMNRARSRAA